MTQNLKKNPRCEPLSPDFLLGWSHFILLNLISLSTCHGMLTAFFSTEVIIYTIMEMSLERWACPDQPNPGCSHLQLSNIYLYPPNLLDTSRIRSKIVKMPEAWNLQSSGKREFWERTRAAIIGDSELKYLPVMTIRTNEKLRVHV